VSFRTEKIFGALDVRRIISDHYKTLVYREPDTNEWSINKADVILFFLIPALVAGALIWLEFNADKIIGIVATAFSIFAALLFNLLLLVFDLIARDKNRPFKVDLLQAIYDNISFAILISILALTAILLFAVSDYFIPALKDHETSLLVLTWARRVFSFFLYYCITNFMLTMIFVLKKVHILLSEELKAPGS
jgi:hypothetical protein